MKTYMLSHAPLDSSPWAKLADSSHVNVGTCGSDRKLGSAEAVGDEILLLTVMAVMAVVFLERRKV